MKYKRAYKYRFYPTDEQKRLLARTFGCARYIYNWGLRKRTDAYYKQGTRLYYDDLSAQLTELKKQDDHSWLNEVSAVPLQQSLRHLDRAFVNFFEGRARYPIFKNKHGPQAATYASNAFTWDGQRLTLAKSDLRGESGSQEHGQKPQACQSDSRCGMGRVRPAVGV